MKLPDKSAEETPKSPEVQREYVRDELDQDQVTHRGDKREAPASVHHDQQSHSGGHMGAVDDEVVPVVPLMSGPADLIGEKDEDAQGNSEEDELFDPYDHITPG